MTIKFIASILSAGVGIFSIPASAADYLVKLKSSIRSLDSSGPSYSDRPLQVSEAELNELVESGLVEAFEPNYTYYLMFGARRPKKDPPPPAPTPAPAPRPTPIVGIPNDLLFKSQWALSKTNALAAWSTEKGKRQIRVAVMDTGVDMDHEDLLCNLEAGFNAVKPGDSPDDVHGHGTHVAGIVAACADNGIGIAGVAQVNIVPIKASRDGAFSNADIIRGIEWAVQEKVDVINMSFGGPSNSKFLYDALKLASDAGILLVAAAGNSAENNDVSPSYPANYTLENLISVASSTSSDTISSFSNYGKNSVHIAAPGSEILSTVVGGSYGYKSGTSMAAPFVAGSLGLLLSRHPQLRANEAKRRLLSGVSAVSGRATQTGGRVDLGRLIDE